MTKIHHHWTVKARFILSALLAAAGLVISSQYGSFSSNQLGLRLVALVGIGIFAVFAAGFLQSLLDMSDRLLAVEHYGAARVATLKYALRVIGYIGIGIVLLDRIGVPVGKLLVGGAVLGIILGVAAQQALANFFASLVLSVSRPFSVGQHVIFTSGALGGEYTGTVVDIGLTHTRLLDSKGEHVLLPNAMILSGASIKLDKRSKS